MANIFNLINRANFAADMQVALVNKYGENITVHYAASNVVIFTCAALSSKVIKIEFKTITYSSYYLDTFIASYGDTYNTGSTITNPVYFCGETVPGTSAGVGGEHGIFTNIDLILGDSFLLLSGNPTGKNMVLVGILSNNQHICIGFDYRPSPASYPTYCTGYAIGLVGQVIPFSFGGLAISDGGKFITAPINFTLNNVIMKNDDGSYATLQNLFVAAYNARISTDTFYCSDITWYDTAGKLMITSSLFAPIG